MDTQTLRTFVTLSSLKNFTQTADLLFIAQSTVTNRIADLEREIGKKLFTRDKKTVCLTKEGQIFLTYAKRILELEDRSIQEMNSFCYDHHLRIGSTNTIYECHLYPLIRDYMIATKDTSVKVILNHSSDLLHMLQDGTIDVAYSYIPLTKAGFVCTPCYTDELILVSSFNHTEYKNGIRRENLSELNYLMCNFALQEVGMFIRALFPNHYQFPFEIDNSTKLIQYLKDGLGYSFLPYSLVKQELESQTLISIPLLDFETPKIMSYCIYHESNSLCTKLFSYITT